MAKKTAPPEAPKTSVGDPRGTYLDALLRQIQARAISIRHYLGESKQNPMLGLAAEKGVRDVLRQVLPRRFGVTSGFMCDADGSLLAAAVEKESVSRRPTSSFTMHRAHVRCTGWTRSR